MRTKKPAKAGKTAEALLAVWQSTFGEASLIKWKYRRKRLYELGLLCLFTGRTEEAFKQAELMADAPKCEDVCCGQQGGMCAEAFISWPDL